MDISKAIRTIREEKRLTQLEVAETLKMERSNYARLESRGNKLTVEQLEQIANVLGVSVMKLLFGDSENIDKTEKLNVLDARVKELESVIKDKDKIIANVENNYNKLFELIEAACSAEIIASVIYHGVGKMKVKVIPKGHTEIVSYEEYRKGAENEQYEYLESINELVLTDEELVTVFASVLNGTFDFTKTQLFLNGFFDNSMFAKLVKRFTNIAMKQELFKWNDMGEDEGFWMWDYNNKVEE